MINIERIQQTVKKKNSKSYKIVNFLIGLISKFFQLKDRQSLSLYLNYKYIKKSERLKTNSKVMIRRIEKISKKKTKKSHKIVNFLIGLISKFFQLKDRQSLPFFLFSKSTTI